MGREDRDDCESSPLTEARPNAEVREGVERATKYCSCLVPGSKMNEKLWLLLTGSVASFTYITLSASMILFNKHMMRPEVFPYPVALTTLHMAGSFCMASLLRAVFPSLFPAYARVFAPSKEETELDSPSTKSFREILRILFPFAPIAACGATCLVCGNAAYRFANVAFLQMVKESHIMFVYVMMLIAGLEIFKHRMALVITFVACSAMLAVYGEIYFSMKGLALQMVSGASGSGQIVLNNLLMARSSGGKIDPLTMVLCTAPVMLIIMLPVNVFYWDPRILVAFHYYMPIVLCNAALAFALQVSAATLIWVTSGTGYALVCVAKDLAIVAAAGVVLQEHFTWLQIVGFSGSVAGMGLYSAMKLFPEAFEPSN